MPKIAICPGSFDPLTNGHINIVERGLKIFDKIIVAVGIHIEKEPIFTPEERISILKKIFKDYTCVEIAQFDGLLAEFAKEKGAMTILRGIRNMSDYEAESQMALANKTLYPELETIFMMTEGKYSHVSSSIIKEIISLGGSGQDMIHPIVETKLKQKLKGLKK